MSFVYICLFISFKNLNSEVDFQSAEWCVQGPTEDVMATQNEAQERGIDPPYRNHIMLLVEYGDDSNNMSYFTR